MNPSLLVFSLLILTTSLVRAQGPAAPQEAPEEQARRRSVYRAVELHPDDVSAFPPPPVGFDVRRDNIVHGKLEMTSYESKTVGTTRKLNVYTPPGYPAGGKYPVLYLLHGIGGNETEWENAANVDTLMDDLVADHKAVPMIVVMPNGRAQKDDHPVGDVFKAAPAFAVFERDLFDDVIPAVEARYQVQGDREHRALAGLSMGGGQTLNFGLTHIDQFAWLGAFSAAPNTRPAEEILPRPADAKNLKLLFLSCGNKDGLFYISQGMHAYLKSNQVPHVWHVDANGHDGTHWRSSLYDFAQLIFR